MMIYVVVDDCETCGCIMGGPLSDFVGAFTNKADAEFFAITEGAKNEFLHLRVIDVMLNSD